MAARLVVCPECEAEVPYGRLSCAACGTLLASVAGSARRVPSQPADEIESEPAPAGSTPVDFASGSARDADAPAPTEQVAQPPVLRDWTGPVPAAVLAAAAVESPAEPAPPAAPTKRARRGILRRTAQPAADERPAEVGASTQPEPAPVAQPEPVAWPPAVAQPEPVAWPPAVAQPTQPAVEDGRPLVHGDVPESEEVSSLLPDDWTAPVSVGNASVAGAYVAPSLIPAAAAMASGRPATAASIAAASITAGTITSVPAAARESRWFSTPEAPPADALKPGKAGFFSDLPFDAPNDIAGWATAIGAFLGAFAFLLPWAANGVAGTEGFDRSYTGQWGLANAADLVPMLAAIALLLLTIVPSGFSRPIRRVALPILFGGWFFGIAWSYATGPFGTGWGVDAFAIASVLLAIGGMVALWRHEPTEAVSVEATAKD